MSPDDRRKAILDALIPLLVERGGDVTTKEIAAGGGDRGGHDLPGLPRQGHAAVRGCRGGDQPGRRPGGLRGGDGRGRRPARAHRHRGRPRPRPDAADDGGDGRRPPLPRARSTTRPHTAKKKSIPMGPPEFMLQAQRDLHERLTGLFAPYADQLAVAAGDGRPRAAQPDLRLRPTRARPVAGAHPRRDRGPGARRRPHPARAPAPHLGRSDVDQAGAHLPRAVQAVAHDGGAAAVRRHARRAVPPQAERRHHRQRCHHRRHGLHHAHRRA